MKPVDLSRRRDGMEGEAIPLKAGGRCTCAKRGGQRVCCGEPQPCGTRCPRCHGNIPHRGDCPKSLNRMHRKKRRAKKATAVGGPLAARSDLPEHERQISAEAWKMLQDGLHGR